MRLVCYFCLAVLITCLSGCASSYTKQVEVANLVMDGHEITQVIRGKQVYEGVVAFRKSPSAKTNQQKVVEIEVGKDLKLNYHLSIMTRLGAFVHDNGQMVHWSYPDGERWEMFDEDGRVVGELAKSPVADFGTTLYGGHSRQNWSHIEGYESPNASGIRPNKLVCCWSFVDNLNIPFSQMQIKGEWGAIDVPMSVSVYYFDIAEMKYRRAKRRWVLRVEFVGPEDQGSKPPAN